MIFRLATLAALFVALCLAQPSAPFNVSTCHATSGTTCVITLTNAPAAGDAGVVLVGSTSAPFLVTSITGGGLSWPAQSIIRNVTQKEVEGWCGSNASGSGGTTITITMTSTITTLVSAVFVEVSGIGCNSDGGSAVGFAAAHGTSGAPTDSGSIGTTKQKNTIAFSAAMVDTASGFTSMTNGYTPLSSLDTTFIPGYLLTPNIGTTTSTTWSGISSASWGCITIVLRSIYGATLTGSTVNGGGDTFR